MRLKLLSLLAGLSCISSIACAAPEEKSDGRLRFADAQAIAERAQRMATERRLDVSIVVVNREGQVILAHRMDGASIVNHALAEKKAVTAAASGVPTSTLEKAVDAGKYSLLSIPNIATVGGGVPILRDGRIAGGIGVSGGSPEDDEKIAISASDRATHSPR